MFLPYLDYTRTFGTIDQSNLGFCRSKLAFKSTCYSYRVMLANVPIHICGYERNNAVVSFTTSNVIQISSDNKYLTVNMPLLKEGVMQKKHCLLNFFSKSKYFYFELII